MQISPKARFRFWLAAGAVHGALSLGGFWLLSIAGLAVVDSTPVVVPWWLVPLERVIRFGLLQPIAYWVLAILEIRYWTWPGLLLATALIGANTLVAIVVARAFAQLFSRR